MAYGQASAGWYPDPAGETGLLRYWDGQAWTEQTQVKPNPDQLLNIGTPVTPAPVYAPGQVIPEFVQAQPTKKDRKGMAVAGLVLGIVAVVFSCFTWVDMFVAVLAIVFGALGIQSSRKKMAIVGLILGIVGIIFAVIWMFLLLNMMDDPTRYGLPRNFFN
jgi:hypothetical protein